MNTECDLECTCDIGPFASCPACRTKSTDMTKGSPRPKQRFAEQNEDAALAQRIAEIKAGYMK